MPNLRPLLALALALTIAACGASTPSSEASAVSEPSVPASEPATGTPTETAAPAETEGIPTEEVPTLEPIETEPVESVDPSASPDGSAGAAACSGNDDNREWYAGFAVAVDWTVLCAVLPKGWYVSSGKYWLANGGKLVIGYKGPGGATLNLSEGAFCADDSGCVPAGTDAGDVPLGPMQGTLVRLDDGGFGIVVDRGLNPSWLLVSHGLDEATTLTLGAALAVVAVSE